MHEVIRRMPWREAYVNDADPELFLTREWLLTNGLGGYASGTISGILTRRYHGLLIASLPAPLGRIVMLSQIAEVLRFPDGEVVQINGGKGMESAKELPAATYLTAFRLENGLPVWSYEVKGIRLEKRALMVHMQNTVHVTYDALSGPGPVRLELRPLIYFRSHSAPVSDRFQEAYQLTIIGERYEISAAPDFPPLRLLLESADGAFSVNRETVQSIFYRSEAERGYESQGVLWSPGYFSAELHPGQQVTLIASTEPWMTILALQADEANMAERRRRQRLLASAHPQAQVGTAAELVLATDQFIVTPAGRMADTARARAAGDEVRSIIAGYHWFTDWGRDTMISLEGLTLTSGRHIEAGWILRAFARYIRDGLIPNLFPEGENEGLYHTVDATLWFFHALDRYLEVTQDRATLTSDPSQAARYHRTPSSWDALRYRSGSTGWPAPTGSGRVPTDVDGCQGGRLGCDAAARQSRRDQCPLVQRPTPARGVGARRAGGRGRQESGRICGTSVHLVQPALLVR